MDEKSINEACKQIMVMIKTKKEEKNNLDGDLKNQLEEVKLKYDQELAEHKKAFKSEETEKKLFQEGVDMLRRQLKDVQQEITDTQNLTNGRIAELEKEISTDQEVIAKLESNIRDSKVSDLEKEVNEVKKKYDVVNDQYHEVFMKSLLLDDNLKGLKTEITLENDKHAQLEQDILSLIENKKNTILKLEQDLDTQVTKHIEKENQARRDENEAKREVNELYHLIELQVEENKTAQNELTVQKKELDKQNVAYNKLNTDETNLLAQIAENQMLYQLALGKLLKINRDIANVPDPNKIEEEKKELYGNYEKISEKLNGDILEQQRNNEESEVYNVEISFIKNLISDSYKSKNCKKSDLEDLKKMNFEYNIEEYNKLNVEMMELKRNLRFKTDQLEDLKLRKDLLEERENKAKSELEKLKKSDISSKLIILQKETDRARADRNELKEEEEKLVNSTDRRRKDIEDRKKNLNLLENRLLQNINNLETEIKMKNQIFEVEIKKINRFTLEIEEKKSQITIKQQQIDDIRQRLEELEMLVKPKLDISIEEGIERKIKVDPVTSLKEGLLILLRRIAENSHKYKARKEDEITSGLFDPSIQLVFDRVIYPSLLDILSNGFVTSWFTPHYWVVWEKIVYDGAQEHAKYVEIMKKLMEEVKTLTYHHVLDYDLMSKTLLSLALREKLLFFVIDGYIKQEYYLKRHYTTDSIMRNTEVCSRVRSFAIVLSKTPFKLKLLE